MEPFVGEIRCFSFGRIPVGWHSCDGSLLPINQNQALYSLLGTAFGGDGKSTFGIPDLRGVVPIQFNVTGSGPNQGTGIGVHGGVETVTLTQNQMPAHNHMIRVNNQTATGILPTNDYPAALPAPHLAYAPATSSPAPMASDFVGTAGGSDAHTNMQPYAVVNYCIATTGYYPPRS